MSDHRASKLLSDDELYAQVVAFVRSETSTRSPLTRTTDLLKGLGVDGDDARELMEGFASRFGGGHDRL